jgi:hypothetical protein
MTHEEFEAKLGSKVSDADYAIIERVYTFHPVISNTKGKQQIVDLYKIGGMRVIKDMIPTAERGADEDGAAGGRGEEKGVRSEAEAEGGRTEEWVVGSEQWGAQRAGRRQTMAWIGVDEQLPGVGERVLAAAGGFVGEAYLAEGEKWMRYYGAKWMRYYGAKWSDALGAQVRHWMPMPRAPGEEANRDEREE